ncbi:WbqC family protein [Ensifer sp. B1-9]|uniref:WbqC family protein n=1 Tax=Ensifer sp. B1-9 TaxID=3141455 RepID=UPI003D228638
MDRTIVVSQSMYFPWVGLLEQVRLADVFVHYDDVQFARGFFNRVQVKTSGGRNWITVPLRDHHQGDLIDEVVIDDREDWRSKHRKILQHAYQKAPFRDDMLKIVDKVFDRNSPTLAELARHSILELVRYFDLPAPEFLNARALGIGGSGSQRLYDIVTRLDGTIYVTGHGAKNYLDHELFERNGVNVRYMSYELTPYPQLYGEFTPYVTGLDLVANCGPEGANVVRSGAIDWKEFTQ